MTLEQGSSVIGGALQEDRVGWIGVGGSGRPGEKRLGFQPGFWEGRYRPAGPTPSQPRGVVPPPPTEGPRQLCLPSTLPAQPRTRLLSLFSVSSVALDPHFVSHWLPASPSGPGAPFFCVPAP